MWFVRTDEHRCRVGGCTGAGAFGIRAFTTTRAVGSFGLKSDEPSARDHGSMVVASPRAAVGRSAPGDGEPGARRGCPRASNLLGGVAARRRRRRTRRRWSEGRRSPSRSLTAFRCSSRIHRARSRCSTPGGEERRRASSSAASRRWASAASPPSELCVHTGPSICGKCYEVSADVYAQLTGRDPGKPTTVDLRDAHRRACARGRSETDLDDRVVHPVRQRSILLAPRRRRRTTTRRHDRGHVETRVILMLAKRAEDLLAQRFA